MNVKKFHKELLASDAFVQFSLRSTIFVKKLCGLRLLDCIKQVTHLTKLNNSFDWSDPQAFGIEQEAWERIEEKGIEPVVYFAIRV